MTFREGKTLCVSITQSSLGKLFVYFFFKVKAPSLGSRGRISISLRKNYAEAERGSLSGGFIVLIFSVIKA